MQTIKTVHLVYFSVTGGTARVTKAFEKAFMGRQVEVFITELNASDTPDIDADLLVLLFPVYAANAPLPIDEWISQAPAGEGRPAAVISVSGGGEMIPNTACRVAVIRQLANKGYDVCYESMFVMPANLFISYSDTLIAMLLAAANRKAALAADEILAGKTRRTKPLLWDRLASRVFRMEKKYGKSFGKKLKIKDTCTGCARCANHCPRGNITIEGAKPVFGEQCVMCLRCIYGCPQNALVAKGGRFYILKDGYDLNAIEKRTEQISEYPPPGEIAKGLLFKGVKKYLEE
jgi:ferredoxin/flavodoxin